MSYMDLMDKISRLHGRDDEPKFREICKEYIQNKVGSITADQFEAIFDYAWEQGHASAYPEAGVMLTGVVDLVEVVCA